MTTNERIKLFDAFERWSIIVERQQANKKRFFSIVIIFVVYTTIIARCDAFIYFSRSKRRVKFVLCLKTFGEKPLLYSLGCEAGWDLRFYTLNVFIKLYHIEQRVNLLFTWIFGCREVWHSSNSSLSALFSLLIDFNSTEVKISMSCEIFHKLNLWYFVCRWLFILSITLEFCHLIHCNRKFCRLVSCLFYLANSFNQYLKRQQNTMTWQLC